jgi:hypothetical protein
MKRKREETELAGQLPEEYDEKILIEIVYLAGRRQSDVFLTEFRSGRGRKA